MELQYKQIQNEFISIYDNMKDLSNNHYFKILYLYNKRNIVTSNLEIWKYDVEKFINAISIACDRWYYECEYESLKKCIINHNNELKYWNIYANKLKKRFDTILDKLDLIKQDDLEDIYKDEEYFFKDLYN